MKKIITTLLAVSALAACSKKDKDNNTVINPVPTLEEIAQNVKLEMVSMSSDIAYFRAVGDNNNLRFVNISLEVSHENTSIFMNMDQTYPTGVLGLDRNTKYDVRLILKNSESQSKVVDSLSFTTSNYRFNFHKMYDGYTPDWFKFSNKSSIMAVESGTQVFYGEGFFAQTNTAVLIPEDDSSKSITLKVKTISDTSMALTFPADAVPESPYIDYKKYYLKINNEIIRSSNAFNSNILDSATLKLFNKDITLDAAQHYPDKSSGSCKYISLRGKFLNNTVGISPFFIQGIQAIPKKSEVEIYQGLNHVSTIVLAPASGCNTGYRNSLVNQVSGSSGAEYMYAFNEIQEAIIYAELQPGTYTMNLKFTMDDNSERKTNAVECLVVAK